MKKHLFGDRLSGLVGRLFGKPANCEQLVDQLRESQQRGLLGEDALAMIEGVLHVSEMQVRDIMVPRSHVTVVSRDASPEDILPLIVESGHSRFPVIGESKDEVVGILLAKDLLRYCSESERQDFRIRDVLRTAVFVPESKRLNVLLKEFRSNRIHIAIVVDEYGGVAGMVTIEDVLEQIVGEIEDEHDIDEESFILRHTDTTFTLKALTEIEDFNKYFHTEFSNEEFDTIGGLVMHELGHLPKRGESVNIQNLLFKVLRADNRRIHSLQLTILPPPAEDA